MKKLIKAVVRTYFLNDVKGLDKARRGLRREWPDGRAAGGSPPGTGS